MFEEGGRRVSGFTMPTVALVLRSSVVESMRRAARRTEMEIGGDMMEDVRSQQNTPARTCQSMSIPFLVALDTYSALHSLVSDVDVMAYLRY
jgi:hypothetical protein